MSLVSGMLAVQSMSSCFTVSHIHYDEGRGRSKDFYCEYEGRRIMPGETYKNSQYETCTCDENGLECCKNKKVHTRRGHTDGLDPDFLGEPPDAGRRDRPSKRKFYGTAFSGERRARGKSSGRRRDKFGSAFDEYGAGLADEMGFGDRGFSGFSSSMGNSKGDMSSDHSTFDSFDFPI